MERIVVAAKAGADQPWVADAAAELAQQTGADAAVVSIDGVDLEALSPLPRSEYQENARESANKIAERIREHGIEATAETRSGKVVPGILLFAEERDADLIVVGHRGRSAISRFVEGSVSDRVVRHATCDVLVVR